MRPLRGKTVYYWHSASYVHAVKFVRWCVMRMGTGREDSNRLGVGAVLESDWLYSKLFIARPEHGLRRGQSRLRPYHELYRTYADARSHRRAIKRPTLEAVKKTRKRRRP